MSALEERVAEALRTNGNTIPEIDAAVAVAAVYDELTRPGANTTNEQMLAAALEAGRGTGGPFVFNMRRALTAALAVAFADDTQEQP